jgi:hypothetical protein
VTRLTADTNTPTENISVTVNAHRAHTTGPMRSGHHAIHITPSAPIGYTVADDNGWEWWLTGSDRRGHADSLHTATIDAVTAHLTTEPTL